MASNPTLLSMPIAENGTKNIIPENQSTPGNGLMSQSTGFPAECSLPLGAGGVAPDRADFNGAFNLLSGVAFMAQKGFTFNYDATQDYYAGCVVMDNGNKYLCIADMSAGTVAPSADTTHDYWIFYPVGVINKRDIITTSGTYTAPVTGWYKITVKGGGGGGGGGVYTSSYARSGYGGGEGGTTIAFEKLSVGDVVSVIVGAGGTGGSKNTTPSGTTGGLGGDSIVTVNGNTYTGGGGNYQGGGTGTIPGISGQGESIASVSQTVPGGTGGGTGGGNFIAYSASIANSGSGGRGGNGVLSSSTGTQDGFSGADGFIWFEYFAEV